MNLLTELNQNMQNLRNDYTVKLLNVIFSFYNSKGNIYKDNNLRQLEVATEKEVYLF
jgi:hypothetical protein